MKFSPNIGKLVFKLYMAVIALLVIGVAVLLAPLLTSGSALVAVLQGDLDTALVRTATDDQWLFSRSLLNAGANPDTTLENGQPLLLAVAAQGNIALVKLLIDHGATPTATDTQGRTALDIARQHAYPELINLLESRTPKPAPGTPATTPQPGTARSLPAASTGPSPATTQSTH